MNQGTPLAVLEKHGETHSGPAESLPEYGGEQHGIWAPMTKSWAELGIDAKELRSGSMASAVGEIPGDGGEFLPFLKKFRLIVESKATIDEKLERARELASESRTYRLILAGMPYV